MTVLAVETGTAEMLALLDPQGTAALLISGQRAAALSLGNRRESADPAEPVVIQRSGWLDFSAARALADPGLDFDRPPIGPLEPLHLESVDQATAALGLARGAGLLPALWIVNDDPSAIAIAATDILAANSEMTLVARANLPLDGLPKTQILAYRACDNGEVHVALVIGAFGGRAPLVRLHSECLTGDVFGSLKCDCGAQLGEALKIIAGEGGGILLYLRQEGRGIGLANKLRAYALQDRGLDTVEANLRIGFADDERDYAHAGAMLRQLKAERVRLLSNNPAKVAGLEAHGIEIVERVAHQMPANPHNAEYLAVKRGRSGHLV